MNALFRIPSLLVLFGLFCMSVFVTSHPSLVFAQESSSQDNLNNKIVTGILKELDLKEKRGTIMTDLGNPVFFELPYPEMLADISEGQHVTAGINEKGVLTKIIETPVPEMKNPF